MTMIFNLVEKNYPNTPAIHYLGKHYKEYFLKQLKNLSFNKKWDLVILFGLFFVLKTKLLNKVFNIGLKLWT